MVSFTLCGRLYLVQLNLHRLGMNLSLSVTWIGSHAEKPLANTCSWYALRSAHICLSLLLCLHNAFPIRPIGLVQFVIQFRLREKVTQHGVGYKIRVETEPIGARIGLASLADDHTVICAQRISNAWPKCLGQDHVIARYQSALLVDIILCEWYFCLQWDWFIVLVLDGDWVCLVPTSPDD